MIPWVQYTLLEAVGISSHPFKPCQIPEKDVKAAETKVLWPWGFACPRLTHQSLLLVVWHLKIQLLPATLLTLPLAYTAFQLLHTFAASGTSLTDGLCSMWLLPQPCPSIPSSQWPTIPEETISLRKLLLFLFAFHLYFAWSNEKSI